MYQLTVRQRLAALVLFIFLAVGGILLFLSDNKGYTKEFTDNPANDRIYAYVCGAVVHPGVLRLQPGTRKFEALQKVGGALPDADLTRVNLAEFVQDGEQIYVPKQGEIIPSKMRKQSGSKTIKAIKPTKAPKMSKEPKMKDTPMGVKAKANPKSKVEWPIDLNSATKEQLDAVPGIGPSLAGKIIAYREKHGRFQSYQELDQVGGVGPSKLEKFRPYLTVK